MLSNEFNTNKKSLSHYCDLYGYMDNEESAIVLSNKLSELKYNKLKELHIDMYAEEPYMLFLKTDVKNAEIIPDEHRVIIKNGSANKSTIMNIIKEDIDECVYKRYDSNRHEIVFTLNGILYKMFVLLK